MSYVHCATLAVCQDHGEIHATPCDYEKNAQNHYESLGVKSPQLGRRLGLLRYNILHRSQPLPRPFLVSVKIGARDVRLKYSDRYCASKVV